MRDAMLIVHFIGLAMGLGTSLAFLFLGMAAAKMEKDEAQKFMMKASSLSKMGHYGLVVLILSGGYLMTPYWKSLASSPLMMAKLTLVLALGALLGIMSSKMRKAKNGDSQQMKSLPILSRIALLVTLTIVVLAVFNFH